MKVIKRIIKIQLSFTILMVASHTLHAQGIKFVQALNWQQLKERAKTEHKYIFVDCYATWCVPCRTMDSKVYQLDSIGNFINANYIPIKIQFDKTKSDNDDVKAWYTDAENLSKEYQITEMPTFLFFSPEGKLVHRAIGYKDPKRFMGIVRRSLDPAFQYYTLLEIYHEGKMPLEQLGNLAGLAKSIVDEGNANDIFKKYNHDYLLKLDDKKLYTVDNIRLMTAFLNGKNEELLHFFETNSAKINAVMANTDYAQSRIMDMIKKIDLEPIIQEAKDKAHEPDWKSITAQVGKKYNAYYSKRIIIDGKIAWYTYLVKEKKEAKYWRWLNVSMIDRVKELKIDTNSEGMYTRINSIAYEYIYLHSDDKTQLKTAIGWLKPVVETFPTDPSKNKYDMQPAMMDTYACLQYKIGNLEVAIQWEKKALEIYQYFKNNKDAETVITTIAKMKTGKKIWLDGEVVL